MKNTKIEIIHQDKNLLVINKPSGISVTGDRSGKDDILKILRLQLPEETDLRLIHRLDKHTSGVMLIAKNLPTQSQYSSWFEKRVIKKTYLAIVSGAMFEDSGTIDVPLARNRQDERVMRIDRKRGKAAITNWKRLADFGLFSLLAVSPITGRTHQIRVHMATHSMPLAIDPLYSATRPILLSDIKHNYRLSRGRIENPLIERLTLHAYQLQVPSDASMIDTAAGKITVDENQMNTYIAPLDKKFVGTIKMLTKHNPNGPESFRDQQTYENILAAKQI
jgi:RluA family pseudouridine synthase